MATKAISAKKVVKAVNKTAKVSKVNTSKSREQVKKEAAKRIAAADPGIKTTKREDKKPVAPKTIKATSKALHEGKKVIVPTVEELEKNRVVKKPKVDPMKSTHKKGQKANCHICGAVFVPKEDGDQHCDKCAAIILAKITSKNKAGIKTMDDKMTKKTSKDGKTVTVSLNPLTKNEEMELADLRRMVSGKKNLLNKYEELLKKKPDKTRKEAADTLKEEIKNYSIRIDVLEQRETPKEYTMSVKNDDGTVETVKYKATAKMSKGKKEEKVVEAPAAPVKKVSPAIAKANSVRLEKLEAKKSHLTEIVKMQPEATGDSEEDKELYEYNLAAHKAYVAKVKSDISYLEREITEDSPENHIVAFNGKGVAVKVAPAEAVTKILKSTAPNMTPKTGVKAEAPKFVCKCVGCKHNKKPQLCPKDCTGDCKQDDCAYDCAERIAELKKQGIKVS